MESPIVAVENKKLLAIIGGNIILIENIHVLKICLEWKTSMK